ncbi:hypothetical protein FPV67DRAFT_1478342 [Lyophyllum atratum]|nr:hypothetical protein FPV67DRAFT_1478342 [Lyophyllum atratum]
MFNWILTQLGLGKKINVSLWGPNVYEQTALVNALKTGEYIPNTVTIFSISEKFDFGDVTIEATVPDGNEGARRNWRWYLSNGDFDGIVYVVDLADIDTSKSELKSLLNDEIITIPIVIIAPKSVSDLDGEVKFEFAEEELKEKLEFDPAKHDDRVAFFMYLVSESGHLEGIDKAFQWLLDHLRV